MRKRKFMKIKANELIDSIACLMLRPTGSNIEFGKPTVRCKPQVDAGLTLHKVSY